MGGCGHCDRRGNFGDMVIALGVDILIGIVNCSEDDDWAWPFRCVVIGWVWPSVGVVNTGGAAILGCGHGRGYGHVNGCGQFQSGHWGRCGHFAVW